MALLTPAMAALEQEEMWVMLLDTRNGVMGVRSIYKGSLNTSVVRIGEIFRPAIEAPAAAIIVCHNHYTEVDYQEETMRLTDGRGADVVYDSVGKDTCIQGRRSLRPRGFMVPYGQSSGAVAPVHPQILNRYGSLC